MKLVVTLLLTLLVKTSFANYYWSHNLTLVRVRRLFVEGFREPRAPYLTAPLFAEAFLSGYGNYVKGHVVFQQTSNGVGIYGIICGLTPGHHGLHIHEYPKRSAGCDDVGAHFNPTYAPHGSMKTRNRHCGDLGNVYAGPDGVAHISTFSGQISLFSGHSFAIGRTLGVTDMPDDYITGNGRVLSCGLITPRSASVPLSFNCPY